MSMWTVFSKRSTVTMFQELGNILVQDSPTTLTKTPPQILIHNIGVKFEILTDLTQVKVISRLAFWAELLPDSPGKGWLEVVRRVELLPDR